MITVLATIVLVFGMVVPAMAVTSTGNHTVTIAVSEIAELAVNGGNVTLTISTATAGSLPDAVTDTATSLNWTANRSTSGSGTARNITAQLDTDYSAGIVLKATLSTTCSGGGSTNGSTAGHLAAVPR
jgi:hypothetical protein